MPLGAYVRAARRTFSNLPFALSRWNTGVGITHVKGVSGVDGTCAPMELLRSHRCCYVLCAIALDLETPCRTAAEPLPESDGVIKQTPMYWDNYRVTRTGRERQLNGLPAALWPVASARRQHGGAPHSSGTVMSAGYLKEVS